jgi:hypothetical protein
MEKASSQSQQEKVTAGFEKAGKENVRRMEELFGEIAKLEAQGRARVEQGVDESAKLMKETLAYGAKLSEGWRALTLVVARQTAELMTSSWL